MADPLLRTLLRTLPRNPFQNLPRTLLRTLCCRTTPQACTQLTPAWPGISNHRLETTVDRPLVCNGQIVGQPRKRECRQNVRKMSKKCPEGLKTQFLDVLWQFLPICSMLLFGDPVQCTPITMGLGPIGANLTTTGGTPLALVWSFLLHGCPPQHWSIRRHYDGVGCSFHFTRVLLAYKNKVVKHGQHKWAKVQTRIYKKLLKDSSCIHINCCIIIQSCFLHLL